MRIRLALIPALLGLNVACGAGASFVVPDDTDVCGECPLTDEDSDGYIAESDGGDDCDDNNAAVNPGAREVCNTTDDNCDGQIDEGDVCDTDPPDEPTGYDAIVERCEESNSDLCLAVGTPGGIEHDHMWCSVEFIDIGKDFDEVIDECLWVGWSIEAMHFTNTTGAAIELDVGSLSGIRMNCTFANGEYTSEPSGPEADLEGVNWLAYGTDPDAVQTNGQLRTWYIQNEKADGITTMADTCDAGPGSSLVVPF